ncbi:nitroreductase family protein [[Clostridium] hylemonae]|uniref:nitroreductase family protein n=1 Tax=[Clostridium] hylemonae TaxID=89153 RepID=UPI001FCC4F42|nr:nitroreductase family protein [[Clostridium] hylemonae]BDF05787.1 hypothetical protein CE91St63_28490 [[Clostridium] hylemonae]
MDDLLYEMIFKRRSFHVFRGAEGEAITSEELQHIQKKFKQFIPLDKDIKIDMQICSAGHTTCKRGQEYCLLLYSEKKDNYLQNIGYVGEQLDLYLASLNIGALWFGIGKADEPEKDNMEFVIMIAVRKVRENKFRKDMFKSKRKPVEEIWDGPYIGNAAGIARFAPSACNTQPWLVENREGCLLVFRYRKPGRRGIMPAHKVTYYNRIDMGIFLLFLELCLRHEKIQFERELFYDEGGEERKTLTAKYKYLKA